MSCLVIINRDMAEGEWNRVVSRDLHNIGQLRLVTTLDSIPNVPEEVAAHLRNSRHQYDLDSVGSSLHSRADALIEQYVSSIEGHLQSLSEQSGLPLQMLLRKALTVGFEAQTEFVLRLEHLLAVEKPGIVILVTNEGPQADLFQDIASVKTGSDKLLTKVVTLPDKPRSLLTLFSKSRNRLRNRLSMTYRSLRPQNQRGHAAWDVLFAPHNFASCRSFEAIRRQLGPDVRCGVVHVAWDRSPDRVGDWARENRMDYIRLDDIPIGIGRAFIIENWYRKALASFADVLPKHIAHELASSVRSVLAMAERFLAIWKQRRWRAALCMEETSYMGCTLAAVGRLTGYKTLNLQHGQQTMWKDVIYNKHLLFDKFAVWGKAYQDNLIELGNSPNQIVVTGNPLYDNTIRQPPQLSAHLRELSLQYHLIGVLPQPIIPTISQRAKLEYFEILESFIARYPNTGLLIKHHPVEEDTLAEQVFGGHDRVWIYKDSDLTLPEMFAAVKVVTTIRSTAALEAVYFRVPAVLINTSPVRDAHPYANVDGSAFEVHDMESAHDIMKRILFDGAFRHRCLQATEKTAKDYFYAKDGRSAERICAIISSWMEEDAGRREDR